MPQLNLKYVLDIDNNFVIFSKTDHQYAHADFKPYLREIKSAGFMGINRINNRVVCNGRSNTLDVDSMPVDDSEFFSNFFKNKEICYIHGGASVVFATNLPVETFNRMDVEMCTNVANTTDIVFL